MADETLPGSEQERTLKVLQKTDLSRVEQANELGISRGSLVRRIKKYFPEFNRGAGGWNKGRKGGKNQFRPHDTEAPVFPRFTDPHLSHEKIREHLRAGVERKMARDREENWFPIRMPDDRPFAMCWVGDPHLGEHANWPVLEEHVAIWSKYSGRNGGGMYCVNAGDTIDNWPLSGRLSKLWAERDVSMSTEWTLVRWFFHESGIDWLVWVLGNHDAFNTNSKEMFKEISRNIIPVVDTEAKFVMVTPNGMTFPVHARHEFRGHSQFNDLHAIDRFMKERSDVEPGVHVLGVEGHKHNWAIHERESPDRGYFMTTGRARGYKVSDGYARRLGFNEQEWGASLTWVCNPQAKNLASRCQMFRDVEAGNDYLQFLRKKHK